MPDYANIEKELQQILHLKRRSVAVSFRDEPPASVAKFEGSEPSGCSFWRLAAEGRAFYTVPSDHYNCPVGSYTHNIPLPDERASELPQILEIMTGAGYLRMEEVPAIPTLPSTPKAIIYAPLAEAPVDPDVVMVAGDGRTLMLLEEAAIRANAASKLPLLARPTCMAIPAAMASGTVASAGCIGNRVYTGLADDQLYAAIPGKALEEVLEALRTVVSANETLAQFHQARRAQLASA
jgi:uncharacterized protein (DUF169 family)